MTSFEDAAASAARLDAWHPFPGRPCAWKRRRRHECANI